MDKANSDELHLTFQKNSRIYYKRCTWHPLQEGDNVTIIKDLKIKGSSSALKVGVKVKNIRLVDEVNGFLDSLVKPNFQY